MKQKNLKKSRYRQYLLTIIASLGGTSISIQTVWPSPTIPKLTTDESYAGILITSDQASWVVSGTPLGVLLSSSLVAWLLDKIGRKKSLLLGGILQFLSWIMLIFPVHFSLIIAAQVLGGIGGTFTIMINYLYIGEVVDKDIRGKLSMVILFMNSCGALLALSAGPFLPYKPFVIICSIFPLIYICTFFFAPESPYYLIQINKDERVKKCLLLVNNHASSNEIEDKFKAIKESVESDMRNKITFKELLTRKDYRKPIFVVIILLTILVVGLRTLQYFSGNFVIGLYLQTIMNMADTGIPSEWVSVLYGVVQLPSVVLSAFLVDHLGRRPLLFVSSAATFILLTTLGTFFYLQDVVGIDLQSVSVLPAVCVCLYAISLSIGVSSMPYVMFGELFATNIKKYGGLLFMIYGNGLGFIVLKVFTPATEAFGIYTMFWLFAGVCFMGTLFSVFILPETKNKSLAEIQDMLKAGRTK